MSTRLPSRPIHRTLAVAAILCAALSLVGCGGGDATADTGNAGLTAFIGQLPAASTSNDVRALDVRLPTAGFPVDADLMMDWVEYTYPTLFPKGPVTATVVYNGVSYSARIYGQGEAANYVGITSDGGIYVLGNFTGGALRSMGRIADYTLRVYGNHCAIRPNSCADQAIAPR